MSEANYETFYEEQEVETEEEVEEVIEKEIIKDVVKEVKIPQAKALYPFTGSGITINKDEVKLSLCLTPLCAGVQLSIICSRIV